MSTLDSKFENIRMIIRNQASEHRKLERLKLVSANRPELEDNDHTQEITTKQIQELAVSIRKGASVTHIKQLRRGLLQGEQNINAFLSVNGALTSLVSLLLGEDTVITIQVCRTLTNMATGNHKATLAIIKAAAPYLITFLNGSNAILQDQSAWTLGNMAADCSICRERLTAQGLLPALVKLLSVTNENILESATFALTIFTKYEGGRNRSLFEEGILKVIVPLFYHQEMTETTQFNIYCLLFHLSSTINESGDYFLESNVIEHIVDRFISLCCRAPLSVLLVTPLLRCLGNLCSGPDPVVAVISSQKNFLDSCLQLLYSPYLHLRKETLWLLTNYALSGSSHLQELATILSHMDEVLKLNLKENVTAEARKLVAVAKRRLEDSSMKTDCP